MKYNYKVALKAFDLMRKYELNSEEYETIRHVLKQAEAVEGLVKALKLVDKWLCYDGEIKSDGITNESFVRASNAVKQALAAWEKINE